MAKLPHNPLEGKAPELVFNLADDSSDELVSIVIPHCNRPHYLNICLQSICVKSVNSNYQIIVVDNASGKESQDFLDAVEQKGVCVIRNKKNMWWAAAANQGARAADPKSKYILFMHPDTYVISPVWLDVLIGTAISKNSGLISTDLQTYEYAGKPVQFLTEWCLLCSRECWDKCGEFEESLPLMGAPFLFSQKAQINGFNPIKISQKLVHHDAISAFSISEWERFTEQAQHEIPKLYSDLINTMRK